MDETLTQYFEYDDIVAYFEGEVYGVFVDAEDLVIVEDL